MTEYKLNRVLSENASALNISLDANQLNQFMIYNNELLLWNKKINLVSVKSELDIPIKHFIDSLTPLPLIRNSSVLILDIGAGAGFPGIPLKIVRPSLNLILLEPTRKRASFLKHISRTLNLLDTSVICNTAESLLANQDFINRFDVVISRATFKLPHFIKISSPFLNDSGILIAMKGKSFQEELEEAIKISESLGLEYVSCHEVRLPAEKGYIRNNVVFRKKSFLRTPQ